MLRRWSFWGVVIILAVSSTRLIATVVNGWFDFVEVAAPANPASGRDRFYANSTLHTVACLTSTGADCLKPQDAAIIINDVTTNNVSTTAHGFAPKAPNDSSKYLDGTGAYTVPSGTGGAPSITSGTYGSKPGTCVAGSLYFATDSLYSLLFCSATNTWTGMLGSYFATQPPAVGTLTGFNVGSITTNTTGGGLTLISSTDTGTFRGYYVASTTTTFVIVFGMSGDQQTAGANAFKGRCGMLLHNSSGNELEIGIQQLQGGILEITAGVISSAGAGVSNLLTDTTPGIAFQGLFWLSFFKDGTNYYLRYSQNAGRTWSSLRAAALSGELPNFDGYGVFVDNELSNANTVCNFVDWHT